MTPFDLLAAFKDAKARFYRGEATEQEMRDAADAYRAAVAGLKTADPRRYRRLAVPSVAQMLR